MQDIDIKRHMDEFKHVVVKHELQESAKARAEFLVEFCPNVDIVVVIGPSGVGKTTLLERIRESILERHRAQMQERPDFVPIISTIAVADGHRRFNWRRLYRDALMALGDAFADERKHSEDGSQRWLQGLGLRESGHALRLHLEQEVRLRGTKVWMLDEAQHVVMGGASGVPGDQFDVFKSIAQLTRMTIILSGTDQLRRYLGTSSQLSRRSEVVPFPHYRWDLIDERKMFARVTVTLLKRLPVKGYPDVLSNIQFFYLGSLGCVGVIKDWIARAFARALQHGREVLTLEDFDATRLAPRVLHTMLRDIRSGEESDAEHAIEIADTLMSGSPTRTTRATFKGAPRVSSTAKPGVRKPSRDPVGAAGQPSLFGGDAA